MKQTKMERLAPLMVLALLAVSILTTLLMGARVYQAMTERNAETLNGQVLEQYLVTKIRFATRTGQDSEGCQVTDFSGAETKTGPVLVCWEHIDGQLYKNVIYAWDGQLKELLCGEDYEFEPGDGDSLLDCDELSFERTAAGGLLVCLGDRFFYIGV